MKVELENVKPMEIEKRSFEIITEELGDKQLLPGTELIVKRCIHTSADFDYAKNLMFSEGAVEKALDAIRNGAVIVTDTQMAKAGINKRALARYGGEVYCFMSDEDVAKIAKENGSTRATASMDKAAGLDKKLIFAIGNAPTALVRLYELIEEKKLNPELEVEGVVFTMYDSRTNLSLEVVENVKEHLNENIYKTIIPRNVRLAEAPSYGMPINMYDSRSTGAENYRLLAAEVISRGEEV